MMGDFLERLKGRWVQVKTENMDAIYIASQASYIKRKVAQMMTVHLQVDYPNPTSMFMSFQSKLKNMDMNLSFEGPSPHLSLSDEPVESTVKVDGNQMILHSTGMAYGDTTRYFTFNEENQLVIKQQIKEVIGTRWFERENQPPKAA
ncbi:Oidioi.mRNA.OKI2018_I69.chr1.g2134.t1.cds [Oikopleura dioica]|uniref:Oidioi.mRNA.OKI2018_I69.chr1.g2134.t1.cds n=1 Tax=Oikopleura dioica TaxID=34765 RepID=A0ABN7SX25_OIKDI|nr:Oidioi.mRNA.OKI2018_I69.chr1.g2134.t1.cds [Oikopleura dioica]